MVRRVRKLTVAAVVAFVSRRALAMAMRAVGSFAIRAGSALAVPPMIICVTLVLPAMRAVPVIAVRAVPVVAVRAMPVVAVRAILFLPLVTARVSIAIMMPIIPGLVALTPAVLISSLVHAHNPARRGSAS